MKISLINAGKRFNRDWIFRNIHQEFISGLAYAITGPNGSGKSTLLQVIGGAMMMSEGEAKYEAGSRKSEIHIDQAFRYISIAAPYLELIEEMTLLEFLQFHGQFKPFLSSLKIQDIISAIGLKSAANKQIRFYSSGMKQRVKLAQAIFSDVPCVLLDEPCTNLDAAGIELYHQLIRDHCNNRLVIVSSNDEQEYKFCTEVISILDYKRQASSN
ncbi:ATP-binding cassette domain-containing protein [Niastella caeni]|uniref:ATP-binding cassette domain-containing protein n=1 Tax=Niastella caeni TaxID=2569763 RepID=A0A4S8I0F9_9BACT|nr:ATP-binding cassette domain-containing protein [Niastella caeni]THU41355.1 ATP-binding cassette domain-containing protein [Niastella caeni]